MFHIAKNKNGKFEAAFISKGRLVWHTSPQQYERKRGCYTAIKSLMKYFSMAYSHFQFEGIVYGISESGVITKTERKPSKPYQPSTKKPKKRLTEL